MTPVGETEGFDRIERPDNVGLRRGLSKTVLQNEFDFFGSMVRAKRIFAKHKT